MSCCGACGGQEVTLSGNSFVWKFPLQSNFQCRLDKRSETLPLRRKGFYDGRVSQDIHASWQSNQSNRGNESLCLIY